MQIFVGDVAARGIAEHQPAKFAAMEYVTETGPNQAEHLGGVLIDGEVKGAISIPDLDSFLVGFSADTVVKGLDEIPDDREPPAPTLLHLSFDAMVGSRSRCSAWPPGSASSGGDGASFRALPGSCAPWPSPAWPPWWRWSAAGS